MKQKQLRACFDQIKPREDLVESTLARVHACQMAPGTAQTAQKRSSVRYGFATRLAGAMCAIVLLIGGGIAIGREAMGEPSVARHTPGAQTIDSVDFYTLPAEQEAAMRSRAEARGGEWIILLASIDAVKAQDSGCTVEIDAKTLCAASSEASKNIQMPRSLTLTDEAMIKDAQNAVGSVMVWRLYSDGNGTWVPAEIAPLTDDH